MTHLFFFFRQKTAYEMRISDWSSNVCSSDLAVGVAAIVVAVAVVVAVTVVVRRGDDRAERQADYARADGNGGGVVMVAVIVARKSVVLGKSVSVRVDLGGRRIIKKKTSTSAPRIHNTTNTHYTKQYKE